MTQYPDDPNAVDSREDLAAHILRLRADLLENADKWENATLERYLEALAAWIKASPNWYRNFDEPMPPDGDWTLFARALSAAVVYE